MMLWNSLPRDVMAAKNTSGVKKKKTIRQFYGKRSFKEYEKRRYSCSLQLGTISKPESTGSWEGLPKEVSLYTRPVFHTQVTNRYQEAGYGARQTLVVTLFCI